MNSKRQRRLLPPLVCIAGLLASCGGGGSSSSPPDGPQPPTPPSFQEPSAPAVAYTGSRQPVVATQSNVAELAYRALSLRSLVQSIEGLWVDGPQGAVDSDQTQAGTHGGMVRLRARTDSAGRGYLEADFQNFSDNPGEVVNGRYLQRFRPESGQPRGTDYSFAGPGTLEFDNLTVSQGQSSVSFVGVVRITGVDSDAFDVDLMVSEDGQIVYFENSTLRFSEVQVAGGPRPAVELAGAVYEQDQGRILFSSLGPTPDLGYNEVAGHFVGGAGGGIELRTGGPVTHVRPISFAYASIIMDLDGDSNPETAKRYTWPALAGGTFTEKSVTQGPIANAGERRTPAPGMPTKIHGLFSHDDDGDWLTFEWRLLARPPLSTASVEAVSSLPYFELLTDMPGDYVLGLRVSDGFSTSETSVIVRDAPSESHEVGQEPLGTLELGQPVTVSTPILVDGRAALQWPYDSSLASWDRTGPGSGNFDPTGDPWSAWLTVAAEGLHEIGFRHNTPFAGAPSSVARVSLAVGPAVFETAIDLPADVNALDIHALDFDGDGDRDLALRAGPQGAARIVMIFSTADGLVPGPDVPAGSGEIAHGDLDGDGLTDLLSAADDALLLFRQAQDQSLLPPQSIGFPPSVCIVPGRRADIAIDDVNGDGLLDVIAVHPCADALVSWLRQPDGGLASPSLFGFPNHRVLAAAFGDLNSDGRTDALLTLQAHSTEYQEGVSIFATQPNGTLVEQYFVERTGIGDMGGTIGDVDFDGRNDAVIVNLDEILLFRQQADGTLVSSVAYAEPGGPGFQSAVSLVDLDDDGLKDLFFCDDGRNYRLLLQQPGGPFRHVRAPGCLDMNQSEALRQAEVAATLDVNNDGLIDLVAVTEDARGAVDERALVKVYLQGVRTYPRPAD